MSETYGLEELSAPGLAAGVSPAAEPSLRNRRGLRIALLSLAAAILLLGAAIAGAFGYQAIRNGSPAAAARHTSGPPTVRWTGPARSSLVSSRGSSR